MKGEGFFHDFFFKNWFYQNAYLWHKCAPRGAHLCSLRNNFTAKENNMTNWAFAVLKNYRKLETTAFVKYLMFNFKFTTAVVLTNWSFVSFSPHALNQRSPARSGIENRAPTCNAKGKGRSSYPSASPWAKNFWVFSPYLSRLRNLS